MPAKPSRGSGDHTFAHSQGSVALGKGALRIFSGVLPICVGAAAVVMSRIWSGLDCSNLVARLSAEGSAIRHTQPCPPLGMILDFCQLVPLVIKCHFA